jgi:hypothetical protein
MAASLTPLYVVRNFFPDPDPWIPNTRVMSSKDKVSKSRTLKILSSLLLRLFKIPAVYDFVHCSAIQGLMQ